MSASITERRKGGERYRDISRNKEKRQQQQDIAHKLPME